MIALIFAQAENGVIGRNNDLPWHLPEDLKHFKQLTTGNTIVMGRRTHESIGRALPNRRSIVLTRNGDFDAEDVEVARSWSDVMRLTAHDDHVFVIGGAEVFLLALPHADAIHRTIVHANVEGDVVFPGLEIGDWQLERNDAHPADNRHAWPYSFQFLKRVTP